MITIEDMQKMLFEMTTKGYYVMYNGYQYFLYNSDDDLLFNGSLNEILSIAYGYYLKELEIDNIKDKL